MLGSEYLLREFLGGYELFDLGDAEQVGDFAHFIIQDEEKALEIIGRIHKESEVVVNEDQPEFLERYSLVSGEYVATVFGQLRLRDV